MEKVIVIKNDEINGVEKKLNDAFKDGFRYSLSEMIGNNYIVYLTKCTCGKKKCKCGCCC